MPHRKRRTETTDEGDDQDAIHESIGQELEASLRTDNAAKNALAMHPAEPDNVRGHQACGILSQITPHRQPDVIHKLKLTDCGSLVGNSARRILGDG